jgi:H+-translocating NAD(P) transhydrogenase subunit alpha
METSQIIIELTVLVLAVFVGFEVISKVPTMLHTPLMSGTNAIHGIVLVGAIVVAGLPHQTTWVRIVALVAVALGTMNVVGGFVVTDRMLGMFKRRRETAAEPPVRESGPVEGVSGEPGGSTGADRGLREQG